jgi:hypothetical protein
MLILKIKTYFISLQWHSIQKCVQPKNLFSQVVDDK